jgi:hypothetical protein
MDFLEKSYLFRNKGGATVCILAGRRAIFLGFKRIMMSVIKIFTFVLLMFTSFITNAITSINENESKTQTYIGSSTINDIWTFDVPTGNVGSITFSSSQIANFFSIANFSVAPTAGTGGSLVFNNLSGLNTFTVTGSTNGAFGGSYNVTTGALSAVPVPAAVWMMGTALVGLVSFGRRKTARVA